MRTLKNWTAKRAGGRITIYGKDEAGAETKVVGVDSITADSRGVIALVKDGERVLLAVAIG